MVLLRTLGVLLVFSVLLMFGLDSVSRCPDCDQTYLDATLGQSCGFCRA